jgi:dTDP-4-dehydrorhamnose 3,5-epimerase
MHQLFVPVGFGHAFLTLSDSADVQYKCGGYYAPKAEGSVRWNDSEIAIRWPIASPTLSAKDQQAQSLAEYRKRPAFWYSPHPDPPPQRGREKAARLGGGRGQE